MFHSRSDSCSTSRHCPQLRIMTFLAREENMWRLLSDTRQDPFAQLASAWLGTPLSQVHRQPCTSATLNPKPYFDGIWSKF